MHQSIRVGLSIAAVALSFGGSALGAAFHVSQASGQDTNDGLTSATAWKTIQRACEQVAPGDTVTVHPGIYAEHVELRRTGTAAQPITFQADERAKNRVIVSGADPAIRSGQVAWTLEDAALGLYSTPLGWLPVRVLYGPTDRFPYRSLAELRRFWIDNLRGIPVPGPGPLHGFAWDGTKLYVRLYASGRYGSVNPADHVFKVAPVRGGLAGNTVEKLTDYNWGILTDTPAYVTLDGFTFETPGVEGVWIHAGEVTVCNCCSLAAAPAWAAGPMS